MTKEELLEVLTRVATDKVKGSQGIIVIVSQDGPQGTDITAGMVNMNKEGIPVVLKTVLNKFERTSGQGDGIIITGEH